MRIGFLGGSFNPVHFGHIAIARQAFKEFSLDKVLLIVAAEPPHKEIAFHVSGTKRYEMLKRGLADETGIEASDVELKRKGKSYTYDTVQLLKGAYSDAELFCIVGADMLYDLPNWYKARELLQEVGFIGFARGGEARDVSLKAQELTKQYGAKVHLSKISGPELSSTEIRERVNAARSIKDMLPEAAEQYLYENGLYQPEDLFIKQEKLRHALNEERYIHSIGTVRMAIWLAERYNVDVEKARLAALLHDCAKVSKTQLRVYLDRFQICPNAYAKRYPDILHGPLGAEIARAEYGVEDPEVLLAIANHTVLSQGISDLEKIIYLADKIEPTRDYADVSQIREAAARSLNEGVLKCMEHTLTYLTENKKEIDPCIYWAREYLLKYNKS